MIFWLTRPIVIRSYRNEDQTKAVNDFRKIGLALFEFETEYGKFPDETTIEAVRKQTGTRLALGTKTSNDYFRQLIAAGFASEDVFHSKVPGRNRHEKRVADAQALEKGEVNISYLAGLFSSGNPSRPLLFLPLIPGTDRFDPKPFGGKAIILKIDNSVTSMNIAEDGHVMLNGKNLLDPTNPIWGKEKWTLVWPE
jgi:hypothetical protein